MLKETKESSLGYTNGVDKDRQSCSESTAPVTTAARASAGQTNSDMDSRGTGQNLY